MENDRNNWDSVKRIQLPNGDCQLTSSGGLMAIPFTIGVDGGTGFDSHYHCKVSSPHFQSDNTFPHSRDKETRPPNHENFNLSFHEKFNLKNLVRYCCEDLRDHTSSREISQILLIPVLKDR